MMQLAAIPPISSAAQAESNEYHYFSAEPVNGALGAELNGVDLATQNDDALFEELHVALMRHQVIILRNQRLDPGRLVEIGRQFGELHRNPFVKGLDGYPEIMPIRAEENQEKQFTGLWHSDISWDVNPSMGSLLYAIEVPDSGGDTLFANMVLALSALSPAMQQTLSGLRAEHRVDRNHQSKPEHADTPPDGVMHPVVTIHPVTGDRILFVNEYFTTRFEAMTEAESEPLLQYLFQHATRPDFSCRIRWQPGTLVFWDNRCTQHYATNDYPGQPRLMYRVTIDGAATA